MAADLLGPAEIRELAAQLGVAPTKKLGQNFVHDPNTVRRIVTAAGLGPDDVVLEVGPGLGSLTLGLLPVAAHVHAVEIDPTLAGALPGTAARFAGPYADRLTVHRADALRISAADLTEPHRADALRIDAADLTGPHRADALRIDAADLAGPHRVDALRIDAADLAGPHRVGSELSGSTGQPGAHQPSAGFTGRPGAQPLPAPTALVANLPYNVAVPVVLHLLAELPSLRHGLVMVQKEVADRLVAGPGSKVYGIPSVKLAWHAQARSAGKVPPNVFWPVPNVDSGLVAFTRREPPRPDVPRRWVFAVVDAAFAQRRKTLRAALAGWAGGADRAAAALTVAGVDPGARGESLTVEQFAAIAASAPAGTSAAQ